jgi:X-Pro dipeptidyl-peptidase
MMRRRIWRGAVVLAGVGVLAASALPATGQPQPAPDDTSDAWPATDIFHEEDAQWVDDDALRAQLRRFDTRGPATLSAADEPDEIVVSDGVTQPVFSYEDAIREAVRVPGAVSSEEGDELDQIYVDIIRPAASDGELQVPTIIVPSPYFVSNGRGRGGGSDERHKDTPTRPQVVVGDERIDGRLMTPSAPVSGESGALVDCGLAIPDQDPCPAGADGAIALVERGQTSFASKIEHAAASGAVAVVMYNDARGQLITSVDGAIPSVGVLRREGLALLDQLDEGAVEVSLEEFTGPTGVFPLYYDNYFVPRGYAVAMIDLAGTRGSTGCLDHGRAEVDNTAKVVEWLNGKHVAYDLDGNEVAADWSNGLSGMTGKSWDGTIANGVAATGVDGLATIVPIEGISSWYHWYWHNGASFSGHTPFTLTNSIQGGNSLLPAQEWQSRCATVRDELALGGTSTGGAQQPTPDFEVKDPAHEFWADGDFIRDADQVQASVFVVHGTDDYNVKPINYGRWWDALAEHDVPRKIWLSPVPHEKAFDFRRGEWMDTIHRWYDHWLHGVENGIMDEPVADVQTAAGVWEQHDTWPGGSPTLLRFGQPGADDPRQGVLGRGSLNQNPRSQTFVTTTASTSAHNLAADGFAESDQRLVFMTDELTEPVRLSGESTISLRASIDGEDATLSAFLVDYGEASRVLTVEEPPDAGITCFGGGDRADTGCYDDIEQTFRTQPHEVVARGWANARFLTGEEDGFSPDEFHRLAWDIMTDDYTFEAGHRIGIVITRASSDIRGPFRTDTATVDVQLAGSHVQLPIVGGPNALRRATN